MVSELGKKYSSVNSGIYYTKFRDEISNPSEKMFENLVQFVRRS